MSVELITSTRASSESEPVALDSLHKRDLRAGVPKLLHGDALESLMVIADAAEALPALADGTFGRPYLGNVKLCYLDPPYNTGEQFAYYSDRARSDDWVEALRDNLHALRPLLSSDGSVWLHLDDSEQHRARMVLDEVFGRDAFVATIIWQKRLSRDNRTAFSSMHDYIHVYAPSGPRAWKKVRNGLIDDGAYSNPDNDPRGPWRSAPMTVQAGHATANQFYTVVTPTGARHEPPAGRCWTYSAQRLAELDREGRVYWPRGGNGKPRLKRYECESDGLAPFTIWNAAEVGDTSIAKKSLMREFPGRTAFDTPKPLALLERIIEVATDPDDIVLDFYLGSGTTAVAAQKLGRRWLGVEQSAEVVQAFVLPRLQSAFTSGSRGGIGIARLDHSR